MCLICNNDIFQRDEIQRVLCNEFVYFVCVGLREKTFRKINKRVK